MMAKFIFINILLSALFTVSAVTVDEAVDQSLIKKHENTILEG